MREVIVANDDGTNRTPISSVGAGPDPINNNDPEWSADGCALRSPEHRAFRTTIRSAYESAECTSLDKPE